MWEEIQPVDRPIEKYDYTCYVVDGRGKQIVINSPVTVGQKVDNAFTIYSDHSIYVKKNGNEEVYVNGYKLHDGQKCQAMSGSVIWCGNPARVYRVYMYCRRKQMSLELRVRFNPAETRLTQDIDIKSACRITTESREYEAYNNANNTEIIVSEVYPERYITGIADSYVVTVKEEVSPEERQDFLYRFTTKYNEYAYALEQLKKLDYIFSKRELLGVNGTWYQYLSEGYFPSISFDEKSLVDALEERRVVDNTDMAGCNNLDWAKADSLFRDVAYELMQFHKMGLVFAGLDGDHIHVNENMDSAKLVYDIVSDTEFMSGTTTAAADVYRLGTIMCKALDRSYAENITGWGIADQYWKNLSIKCPDYVVETLQKAVISDARYRLQSMEEFMRDMRWEMKEPECKDFEWKKPEIKVLKIPGPETTKVEIREPESKAPAWSELGWKEFETLRPLDFGDFPSPTDNEDIPKSVFTGYMYGCPLAKTIPGEQYVRTTEVIDYDR